MNLSEKELRSGNPPSQEANEDGYSMDQFVTVSMRRKGGEPIRAKIVDTKAHQVHVSFRKRSGSLQRCWVYTDGSDISFQLGSCADQTSAL